MSVANTVSVEARDQPIEKVVVFNDRAEVKRLIKADLVPGINEVHIKNVTQSLVHDSVRVDGRGDGAIHEVLVQDKHTLKEETDSPKVAELRLKVQDKEKEVGVIQDRLATVNNRIATLDKMVAQIGTGILPKDTAVTVDDNLLSNITKIFSFYDENSTTVRAEQRSTQESLTATEEQLNKLRSELESSNYRADNYSKVVVVVLESKEGGSVELELTYQAFNSSWRPSYDLRVETNGKQDSLKLCYYAQVFQSTGEDWNEVPLVLSTAQPCLGGEIPILGTLEAAFFRVPPPCAGTAPPRAYMMKRSVCNVMEQAEMSYDAAPMMMEMNHVSVSGVVEQALSTEFTITRPANIPSSNDEHKVTIGIVDLSPQLIYECVPSKNTSVFLTASSINSSLLPFMAGDASVYLNSSFIAKTQIKTVSPGERFSCSLGVDPSVRVEYKTAKKYHEQIGLINKSSSNVTEQTIKVTNTKNSPILLILKEHVPRSTDEKIKVRLIHPVATATEETQQNVSDAPAAPKKGARINEQNNLEWTVELKAGEISDLLVKYALEHPKEEKVEFLERY